MRPGNVAISTPDHPHGQRDTGTYGQPTTLTGTLTNSVTGTPISGQTVVLTLNGTQSCTATTNLSGTASCSVTPNEPSGTYTVSGTYVDAPISTPLLTTNLLPSIGSNNVVVNKAPTTVTYTGPTSVGYEPDADADLDVDHAGDPGRGTAPGHDARQRPERPELHRHHQLVGRRLVQGQVSQVYGSVTVTVSYAGNSYYQTSSTSSSERVGCGQGGYGGGGNGGGMVARAAVARAAGARAAAAAAVRAAAAQAAVGAAGPCLLRRVGARAAADRNGRDCGKDQR